MKKFIVLLGVTIIATVGMVTQTLGRTGTKAYANEYFYNNSNDLGVESLMDQVNQEQTILLVNKEKGLDDTYVPEDLVRPEVPFDFEEDLEKGYLQVKAATALEKLFAQAAKEDIYLIAISGYRSFHRQKEIYDENLRTRGLEYTEQYSAKPGYSEHQTGLAIDVSSESNAGKLTEDFENTREGQWLLAHASEYGFIIRYPKGKESVTGYAYEPWHLRYVGEELAKYLKENDMTLDEYLDASVSEDVSPSVDVEEL